MSQVDLRHGHRKRLRERLLKAGGSSLSDYELLEMILFLSHPRGDVKPLAKMVLKKFGTLQRVFQSSVEEWSELKGFGESASATFLLVKELSERLALSDIKQKSILSSPEQLVRYCRLRICDMTVEQFQVFFLDKKKQFICDEIHQRGTVDHTMVYPREIIKKAISYGASFLLLVHNHPSGDCTPSKEDIELTDFLEEVCLKMGIHILDHLIISASDHVFLKKAC